MSEGPFSYSISKDGKVFVYWNGRTVKVFKGPRAERLIRNLPHMDRSQTQLSLAKATGNFKRGNERPGR